MAIPSGGGTEVLKRNSIAAQTTTWTELDWASEQTSAGNTSGTTAIAAHNIMTILNIFWNNQSGAARKVHLKCSASGRSDVTFLQNQDLPIDGTFILNDRLILHPGDKLMFYATGTSVHIWLNYIQQDWTS